MYISIYEQYRYIYNVYVCMFMLFFVRFRTKTRCQEWGDDTQVGHPGRASSHDTRVEHSG